MRIRTCIYHSYYNKQWPHVYFVQYVKLLQQTIIITLYICMVWTYPMTTSATDCMIVWDQVGI